MQTVDLVERAGWTRLPGIGMEASAVTTRLSDPSRPGDTRLIVGKWMYGNDAVFVEVNRSSHAHARGEAPPPPTSVVRVRLENGPLAKQAIAEVQGDGKRVVWRKGGSP